MKTFRVRNATMLLVATVAAFNSLAKADDQKILDAQAARAITSDRTWQINTYAGPGYYYWSWKSDGSVCTRILGSKTGKCDDTGNWRIDGDRLCWELQWFGDTSGLKSSCVAISDQGKGRYLGIDKQGSKLFDFTVLK